MGTGSTIEINGHKYDAATGRMIKMAPKNSHKTIDGFVKGKTATGIHQSTQKSKTLKRELVSKPKPNEIKSKSSKKQATQVQKSQSIITPKFENKERAHRASQIAKSENIKKFSDKPVNNYQDEATIQSAPVAPPVTSTIHQQFTKPIDDSQRVAQKPEKKKKERKFTGFFKRPKAVSVFASVAVVIMIAGYFTYLNIPNFALRIAASKAGFEASLPGYSPSGFSFNGPISYSSGQITIAFKSNTDERQYNIVQKESAWDSQSLLDNYVQRKASRYLTFQERGLTIYVYNGSNATWVDGGIWYTIEGDSLLNSDQLLRIASSL